MQGGAVTVCLPRPAVGSAWASFPPEEPPPEEPPLEDELPPEEELPPELGAGVHGGTMTREMLLLLGITSWFCCV